METESKNEFRLVLAESSKKDKVTVPLMSDVTVPCQLSPETSAVDMEIRWFKGTDCVCLYKEGHVIEGMGYKGRVGLLNKEIERGNVSLKLKNVSKSDDGVYLCQVTSGNRTKEKIVRLSLKSHEDPEMLQQTITQLTEKTLQEQSDEEKMEKSALIAELKEAKQHLKEKDAQIKELQGQINPMRTIEEAMEEDTQLENMQKLQNEKMTISENTAKELEPSKCQRDNLDTKTTRLKKQQLNIEEVKVFTLFTGNTNILQKIQVDFIDTLRNRIENLRKVPTVDESDVVLVLCPIVSQAGTDIKAALNKLNYSTDSKLTVLVVLHHTFDPEKTVLDSSRCVNRTNMLTVDCLFSEDKGILKCQKNSDAFDKAVDWLIQQGRKTGVKICPRQNNLADKSIWNIYGWFSK